MILTEEQKAEVAAHTRRYNELKAAGQEHAPRALAVATIDRVHGSSLSLQRPAR